MHSRRHLASDSIETRSDYSRSCKGRRWENNGQSTDCVRSGVYLGWPVSCSAWKALSRRGMKHSIIRIAFSHRHSGAAWFSHRRLHANLAVQISLGITECEKLNSATLVARKVECFRSVSQLRGNFSIHKLELRERVYQWLSAYNNYKQQRERAYASGCCTLTPVALDVALLFLINDVTTASLESISLREVNHEGRGQFFAGTWRPARKYLPARKRPSLLV